ncbi:caspase family protein [Catenuloplanes atrovinosus]|uniref:Peptidase C14 caspase domain-containing protein n=1 Tax=Catenuloplanes atrovinosus TaxID=137266 RepID=A0AAE3YPL4_9ACTN|nr:caspase family protein [Catenuloplanes atrovinosus]MDR7275994.1 hypothetical protein [Catenuloplanes atrovinosus]
MSARREALIIAIDEYADPGLRRLRAPAHDADELGAVLADPEIGGFTVRRLRNAPAHEISEVLEEFFADRTSDDVLLVHFSGHGLKGADGALHLAATNTKLNRLAATSVAAEFVNRQMTASRSRRIVLLLDCCYAGAFARGLLPRAGAADLGIEEQLAGRGRAVITASSAVQFAFEGDAATTVRRRPSVFTGVLVQGLRSGDADRDGDGIVTLDEMYDHVYAGVRAVTPHQTPGKWVFDMQGSLPIARRPATPRPAPSARVRPLSRVTAAVRRSPGRAVAAGLACALAAGTPLLLTEIRPTRGTPVDAAATTGRTIFRDDFTSRANRWPHTGAAGPHGGYYVNGAYRYGSRTPGQTWWAVPSTPSEVYPTAPANLRMSVAARWTSPDDAAWFGLVCRANGDEDAYIFTVAEGVAHIAKMKNRIFDELRGEPLRGVDLHAGVTLTADCATTDADHTTQLSLAVDGKTVVQYRDTAEPLPPGAVGVTVEMSPQATDAEAEFTGFATSRL